MGNQRIVRDIAVRPGTAAGRPVSAASSLAFWKVHASPMPPERFRQLAAGKPMAPASRSTVELKMHVDGLPVVFLFPIEDVSKKSPGAVASQTDIHSLVSNTLERIVDRIRGSVALGAASPSGADLTAVTASSGTGSHRCSS